MFEELEDEFNGQAEKRGCKEIPATAEVVQLPKSGFDN